MKLFESNDYLSDVESHLILGEVFGVIQVGEELASLHKIQHQVELLRTLESIMHLSEERAVDDVLEDLKVTKDQSIVRLSNGHIQLTSRSVLVCSISFSSMTFFFTSTFIA